MIRNTESFQIFPSPPEGFTLDRYESPFDKRYGSDQMAQIWGPTSYWMSVRKVWLAMAKVQMEAGIVSQEEYDDLRTSFYGVRPDVIEQRETDRNDPGYTGHDIHAAISDWRDTAPVGARILHQGATSEDPLSNGEVMRIVESTNLIEKGLVDVLSGFGPQISKYKDLVVVGYTHNQAAEPTTLGYRLARYAQDFLMDLNQVRHLKTILRGKGIKGAVGTSASFDELLEGTGMTPREHEQKVMEILGIDPVTISGQTYPRKITYTTLSTLAGIGQSAHAFAADMKLMQGSLFDEVREPRLRNDRSSSSMPHKDNGRHAENIKSLSRGLPMKAHEAWITAAEATLERGIEDSAGKRSYLPESFIITDEVLGRTARIIKGIRVFESSINRNLEQFGPFVASEIVLSQLGKKGADREQAYESLRVASTRAVEAIRAGEPNPFKNFISTDPYISRFMSVEEIERAFEKVVKHVGDASERCERFVNEELNKAIGKNELVD